MFQNLFHDSDKPCCPDGSRRFQRITAVLFVVLAMGLPAGALAGSGLSYAIAPGPLGPALEAFARISGINLSYTAAIEDGAKTEGLTGVYTVERGLAVLLGGTGITAKEQEGGWVLKKAAPKAPAPEIPAAKSESRSPDARTQAEPAPDASVALPALQVRDSAITGHAISLEQAGRTLASDVSDLFSATPSVTVSGGGRNAQRIYLRGIEGSNLNITIDGARQGRSLFQHRGNISGLDPDLLKQVFVQSGTDADSGPGALGGSIRFETVDAQDLLLGNQTTGARIKTGYSSVEDGIKVGTDVYALFKDKFGLLAHVSGKNSDDYASGSGADVFNTAGHDRDYLVKLSMLDLEGHSLRLGAQRNTMTGSANWGGAGSDMGEAADTDSAVRQEVSRDSYTLGYHYEPGDNPWLNTRFNLYHNDNQLENVDAGNIVNSTEYGGALKNTSTFELGPTRHRLVVSMDYFKEEGEFETASTASVNDSDTFGLALQERVDFGRFGLTAGARFDDYSAEYGTKTISGSEVSPNIGGDFQIIKGLSLFAEYGEAVRGSSLIPVQWLSMIQDGVAINNGEAVSPEESVRRQGGVRYATSGLFMPGDHLDAEATYFNTHLTNTIEVESGGRRGAPITGIYNNPDTLKSKGFELKLGWGFQQFETQVSFSSFETEDGAGNPVGIIRRKTAASGDQLVWDLRWAPLDTLTLGYTLTYVADLTRVPAGEPERPGYTLHGIQASLRPESLPGLTLSLGRGQPSGHVLCQPDLHPGNGRGGPGTGQGYPSGCILPILNLFDPAGGPPVCRSSLIVSEE